MSERTSDPITRRLFFTMMLAGIGIGVVFPVFASLFVTPKGPVQQVVFVISCIVAGVGLGMMCYVVSVRTSEQVLKDVLDRCAVRLGSTHEDASGLQHLRDSLWTTVQYGAEVLDRAQSVVEQLKILSSEVLAASEEQASGAAEQAAAVTQTSATVEELAQTSRQIADNAEAVVRTAERTLASAEEGMTSVSDTASGIDEIRVSNQQASEKILSLGERSQEIGRVLVIIDEIAEQTKILALNAAIEAARAGEAGKGFSVVAEEIRKLADSVTDSTQEIGRVVREIQTSASSLVMSTERATGKVDEGKDLAHRTADALDRIVAQVEETTDAAKQISIATQQQRTASDQVVISMKEVALVSRQSADSSRQISSAIMELNQIADSLHRRDDEA